MREDKWAGSYIRHRDRVSACNYSYIWYYSEGQVLSCLLPQILCIFAYAPSITA